MKLETRHRSCAFVLLVAAACFAHPDRALAQSDEKFRSVVWGPGGLIASNLVEYSAVFQSSGEPADHFFLNVVRSDGTWVVQNLPVGRESGLSKIATVIPASVFQSGNTYHTTFQKDYALQAPAFNTAQAIMQLLGLPVNYLVNGAACRNGAGVFGDPGDAPSFPLQFQPPPPPPVPPVDGTYHKDVPDLAQGPNECGPTSVANSVTWLDNEHDSVTTNMTTAAIRDVLKDGDHMKTDPNSGTSDSNFLAGKNKFVSDLGLPIDTTPIGGGAGSLPSGDNIKKALAEGADVELSVIWAGGGGHWVTVVGAVNFGKQCGVWINDPDDGEEQAQFHFLDTRTDGTLSLRGYGNGNTVDLTIAETIRPPSIFALLFPFCGPAGGFLPFLAFVPFMVIMRARFRAGSTRFRTSQAQTPMRPAS